MKKLFTNLMVLALAFSALSVNAEMNITATYASGQTGQVAAVAFIPTGKGFAHVRDITLSTTNLNSYLMVFAGERDLIATSASATTNILITGTGHTNYVEWGDYLILNAGTNTVSGYQLRQVISVSTTNIGLADSPTVALASGDRFWVCKKPIEKWSPTSVVPAPGSYSNAIVNTYQDIWLPRDFPSAIMATNATAASLKLFISGTREQ